MRSHTGASQLRTWAPSPPSMLSRCAACTASSGMWRSAGSSDVQMRCSCAGSCALSISSIARPRTMLCAATGENARCLPNRRAVSSASCVWCDRRVAFSLARRASVRRAAPCGRAARWSIAAAASRSSSDQRAARSLAPSRSSSSATGARSGMFCSACCRCDSRVARSCRACELSAATRCASVRSWRPCGTASPAACSAPSWLSAATAALRDRRKRPASSCDRASSSEACMTRSFCCRRQRRAWRGSSSKAARPRSAAYSVPNPPRSSSSTRFRDRSTR